MDFDSLGSFGGWAALAVVLLQALARVATETSRAKRLDSERELKREENTGAFVRTLNDINLADRQTVIAAFKALRDRYDAEMAAAQAHIAALESRVADLEALARKAFADGQALAIENAELRRRTADVGFRTIHHGSSQ